MEYWRDRMLLLEASQNKTASEYVELVSEQYDAAIREIEGNIAKWYTRYATQEGITYSEAKRILNTRELKEFRMTVEEYIKLGRTLDPKWASQLERASVRVHVSRLEALKVQLQQSVERVKGEMADSFDDFAVKTYSDQYYKTLFEVQKGFNIGFDVMVLNHNQIDKVIRKAWSPDGLNFSTRIWNDRTKLVKELHSTLTRGIIQGKSVQKMTKELSRKMEVSKSNAARLIRTEHNFFANRASMDTYKELEVERYEILATLDNRTSDICQDMDGQVFKRSEYEVGVTAPPFHPYCRTTTVPYFDDDFAESRAARDSDGKYITVPASIKYEDWYKKFVKK